MKHKKSHRKLKNSLSKDKSMAQDVNEIEKGKDK